MKRHLKFFLLIGALLGNSSALAELRTVSGTVGDISVYGNGMVLVQGFDFSGSGCSGSQSGFVIAGDNPHKSSVLSLILSAKATKATLEVTVDILSNCWAPVFDGSSLIKHK